MNMIRKILLDQAHAYWLAIYNTPGLAQSERALAGLMLHEIDAMGAEVRAAGAPVAEPPVAGPAAQTRVNPFASPLRTGPSGDATKGEPADLKAKMEVDRLSPAIFPGSTAAQ